METKKIKVEKILKRLPDKTGTGAKGEYTIHKVLASVAGREEAVTLSSFNPIEVQPGSEIEVFEKEFKGEIEFEITRRSAGGGGRQGGGWGGGGGGRGYGKPSYTVREFFALEAFVFKRASERMDPLVSGDVFKALYSTMLIQAAEHGVKIETAPGNGSGTAPNPGPAKTDSRPAPASAQKPKPSDDFTDDIPW